MSKKSYPLDLPTKSRINPQKIDPIIIPEHAYTPFNPKA